MGHRNDHSYSVIKTDFSLFDPEWTAEEELQLMNALLTQGHGNWDELAKCVPLKTADQCKLHFDKFYIENGLVRLFLRNLFGLLHTDSV